MSLHSTKRTSPAGLTKSVVRVKWRIASRLFAPQRACGSLRRPLPHVRIVDENLNDLQAERTQLWIVRRQGVTIGRLLLWVGTEPHILHAAAAHVLQRTCQYRKPYPS